MPKPETRPRQINKAILTSCPHRLAAQDVALSRPKPGFEFLWGHFLFNQYLISYRLRRGFYSEGVCQNRKPGRDRLTKPYLLHAPIVWRHKARALSPQGVCQNRKPGRDRSTKRYLLHAPIVWRHKARPLARRAYAKTRIRIPVGHFLFNQYFIIVQTKARLLSRGRMPKPETRPRQINKAILSSCPHRLAAQGTCP